MSTRAAQGRAGQGRAGLLGAYQRRANDAGLLGADWARTLSLQQRGDKSMLVHYIIYIHKVVSKKPEINFMSQNRENT